MKRRTLFLAPLALLGAEDEKQTSRFDKTYPAPPGVMDIDIVNGSVTVRASRRSDIRVAADIELTASIPEDLDLARREVRFEPRVEGNVFRVWVESPEQRRWNRYNHRHNVEIDMPAGMRLILRSVNGKVNLAYEAAPAQDIFVKNVKGEIELAFPRPLNANFKIKTMNGRIYSAFDLSPIPSNEETQVTEKGMKRIVSRNRFTGGRAGNGGIEVRIEGLNGDIRILERKA